jgi:hypothetical protein
MALSKTEQELYFMLGKEVIGLLLRARETAKARGVDLDKLLDEAAAKNQITIDDLLKVREE